MILAMASAGVNTNVVCDKPQISMRISVGANTITAIVFAKRLIAKSSSANNTRRRFRAAQTRRGGVWAVGRLGRCVGGFREVRLGRWRVGSAARGFDIRAVVHASGAERALKPLRALRQ